jgi:hypothetical protein
MNFVKTNRRQHVLEFDANFKASELKLRLNDIRMTKIRYAVS